MQNVMPALDKDYSRMWQDSIPHIAWGTLWLAVGIVVGYILTISAVMSGELSYLAAIPICSYLAYASFTVVHDAGHGSIVRMGSKLKPLEDVLGWVGCLPLLVVPYRFFQKIHDRHHAFTNDPDRDPDHFSFGDKWYLIPLNCLFIPFQYHILSVTKLRHIKLFRDTYPSTILYFAVVIGSIIWLTSAGFGKELLFLLIIPNVIAVFVLAMFFDYIPHHPHKSQDRYHNTRIFPSRLANMLLLGQNYHLIHHMYPRVPWYKYKEVYERTQPELEAHGAPIEDLSGGVRPGFMTSPNARGFQYNFSSINTLLTVRSIEQLTNDAVAVSFELPDGDLLKYKAGQYITVSKWLNDEQQTRCYSLCTSPNHADLKVGVRHTPGGLMSAYLNHELKTGDELIVQGPFGDFVYPPAHDEKIESLILVAGGSGITPVFAILQNALESEPDLPIHLIYACRNRDSIMFFEHIEDLEQRFSERLQVTYVVAQDTNEPLGVHGRLDPDLLKILIPEDIRKNAETYICGPEGLKDMVHDTLTEMAFPESRIHIEAFLPQLTEAEGTLHRVEISLADGQTHSLEVASNQTVLEVAKSKDVSLPHACGTGTCGTCKFKVEDGSVAVIPDSIPGITSEERLVGFTLACQCKPQGDICLSQC